MISILLVMGMGTTWLQSASPAQAAGITVSVNLSSAIQSNFLGVNGTYHGFAWMPEQVNKGMNDADRARELDRVQHMGLNIARTWYRPDWAAGTSIYNNFDWNATKMQAFYNWLQAMKDRNVDVALQAGWWFTKDTYYGNSGPNTTTDPARYAYWVSESLNQLITVKGFTNIKYLILFTEPTGYQSGTVPSGDTQWSYYVTVINAIHNKLVADGRRNLVKTVGPNNSSMGHNLNNAVSDLNNAIDIYSGHDYNLSGYDGWYSLTSGMQNTVSSTGKTIWLDEYGKQDEAYRITPDYGNYLAQAVAASINAGNQSSFIWLLFDQQYVSTDTSNVNNRSNGDSFHNGIHRWGIAKWPHDSISTPTYPYYHWYTFSMMSKYLGGRNNTQSYATTNSNGVIISATKPNNTDYSFMLINTHKWAQAVTVDLSSPINKTLYRYSYDPNAAPVPTESASLLGYTASFANVTTSFQDTLPARAVVIYSSIRGTAATLPTAPSNLQEPPAKKQIPDSH